MATTTKLAASLKVANPEWALVLQRVANTRPPTRREKEAITGFLSLTPPQQNAVVTIHIRRMAQLTRRGQLNATNPTMRQLGQFLFYDDTISRAARAAPNSNHVGRTTTREQEGSVKQLEADLTSLKRQAQRLVDSGNPSPRDARRVLTRLAQLSKRLVKPSGTFQRNSFRRGDTTTINKWQSVPQYWAEQKEELKHRPAHSKNAIVQAHRRSIIRDAQPSLPSTVLPRRRPTVTFTDGPTARQVFQLNQPVIRISRGAGVRILPPVQQRVSILRSTHGDLTLTAAEQKFIQEDTWRRVLSNSRHTAPATRPTTQQVREAIFQSSHLNPAPLPHLRNSQPSRAPQKQPEHIALARRIAHEKRDRKADQKRREQARQRAKDKEVLNRALSAVLQARRDKRANQTTIKLLREAQRVAAEKKSRENQRRRQSRDFQQLWHLKEKYGSLAAGYAAIDYMRRPSRQNLDKLRTRVAAIKKV